MQVEFVQEYRRFLRELEGEKMSEWSTLRSIWRIRQTSTMGKVMPLLPLIPLAGVLPSTLPHSRRTEAMLGMVPFMRKVMPRSLNEQFGGFLDPQTVEVGLPAIGAFSAYFQDLLDGMKGRKKLVLHSFNVPPEIFHAMGVAPIFTELLTTLASIDLLHN